MKKILILLIFSFSYSFSSCTDTYLPNVAVGDCYNGHIITLVTEGNTGVNSGKTISWVNSHCSGTSGTTGGYVYKEVNFQDISGGYGYCTYQTIFYSPSSTCEVTPTCTESDSQNEDCSCKNGYVDIDGTCRINCPSNSTRDSINLDVCTCNSGYKQNYVNGGCDSISPHDCDPGFHWNYVITKCESNDTPICEPGEIWSYITPGCEPGELDCGPNMIQDGGFCKCKSGYKAFFDSGGNQEGCEEDCSSKTPTVNNTTGWYTYINQHSSETACQLDAYNYPFKEYRWNVHVDGGCSFNMCTINKINSEKGCKYDDIKIIPKGYVFKGKVSNKQTCLNLVDNVYYTNAKTQNVKTDCPSDTNFYCYLQPSSDNNDTGIPDEEPYCSECSSVILEGTWVDYKGNCKNTQSGSLIGCPIPPSDPLIPQDPICNTCNEITAEGTWVNDKGRCKNTSSVYSFDTSLMCPGSGIEYPSNVPDLNVSEIPQVSLPLASTEKTNSLLSQISSDTKDLVDSVDNVADILTASDEFWKAENEKYFNARTANDNANTDKLGSKIDESNRLLGEINDKNFTTDMSETNRILQAILDNDMNQTNNEDLNETIPDDENITVADCGMFSALIPDSMEGVICGGENLDNFLDDKMFDQAWYADNAISLDFTPNTSCYLDPLSLDFGYGPVDIISEERMEIIPFELLYNLFLAMIYLTGVSTFLRNT